MKRNRADDNNDRDIFGASKVPAFFFHGENRVAQNGVGQNQRNLYDFPDFVQFFLRMKGFGYISEILPDVIGEDYVCIIDSRKLVNPVQYGTDLQGRLFICITLKGEYKEYGVITLYRNIQKQWIYCGCQPNSLFNPFGYDDNNSQIGNLLTNPQSPYQVKIGILERIFQSYRENTPTPDF